MIRTVQTRVGENGNCFMACLSSMLEIPLNQVPDFKGANLDPGVNEFLRKYGLSYKEIPAEDDNAPIGLHLALGTSPRGGQHAVVEKDGVLLHDPHPVSDDPRRGLTDVKAYGLLLPLKGSVTDVAPLSGKRLNTAAEALRAKHDEIKYDPMRQGASRESRSAHSMFYQPTASLVAEAGKLLANAKLDDDPVYWRAKVETARKALATAAKAAQEHNYGKAASYQDAALSLAHMVIDKMRNTGRAKDAELFEPFFKGLLKSKDLTELEWRALSKPEQSRLEREYEVECARARRMKARGALHSKVKDALDKRQRMHRALDCVMDRSFGGK